MFSRNERLDHLGSHCSKWSERETLLLLQCLDKQVASSRRGLALLGVFIHKPSLYSVWVNRIGLGNGSNVKIEACLVGCSNSHKELRFGSLPCVMKSKPLILLLKSTALGFLYKKITINFYCIYYLLSLFKQLYSYNSISRNQFA